MEKKNLPTAPGVAEGNTSRRAFVRGLAIAPLAGLITAVPITAVAAAGNAEWNALMARYIAANEAEETFWRDIYDPALDACEAEIKAIPHVETVGTYPAMGGGVAHMRTSSNFQVTAARQWLERDEAAFVARMDDFAVTSRELLVAVDRREQEERAIRARYRLDELDAQYEALADRRRELETELLGTPSPNGAAAAWKLDHLLNDDGTDSNTPWSWSTYAEPITADIRRVLMGEA